MDFGAEVGQHSHRDYDELFLFFGSNPHDNSRLGGEVEMWLGHGEDAQKFIVNEPTAKWVPREVAHNPWIVTKVDDPKYPVIIMVVALTPKYTLEPGATTNYPYPPAFSMDKLGQEQPGKGLYTEYVNKMPLSQTIIIPTLRGRCSVPNLMFDDNVYKAPVWVEIFHVYAGGQGVGTPTIEVIPARPGQKAWDMTKGMQHSQDFDEIFLFIPTDPHDTLNLGGEVETWLGDEKFSITKSSSVYVPKGVPHNPQYFKRVDRPYLMVVIALVNNWEFFDGTFEPTPAPASFKF
jgi:mannose-6-phosphate isomerase-like protein (cupin superfamily)